MTSDLAKDARGPLTPAWETLSEENTRHNSSSQTIISSRLRVPGGWIIRTVSSRFEAGVSVAQTFIADGLHQWEITHE